MMDKETIWLHIHDAGDGTHGTWLHIQSMIIMLHYDIANQMEIKLLLCIKKAPGLFWK